MAEVACVHCGRSGESAGRVGLPGRLGEDIERHVCAECWRDWLQTQIRVINHYGLRPALKEDREKLYEFMRQYLGLPSEAAGERA